MGEVKVKEAWSEVGKEFSGLGERLKGHFGHPTPPAEDAEDAVDEAATALGDAVDGGAAADDATATAEAKASEAGAADALKAALRHLGEALDGVVEAIGGAAKDPAVAEDVRHVGQSLVTALSATFSDASGEIRKAFNRDKSDDDEPTVQDAPPTAGPGIDPPTQPSGE